MSEQQLSLAINGRERELQQRLVAFEPAPSAEDGPGRTGTVAIVGLGYVGLPTALGLRPRCERIIGLDTSESRLKAVSGGEVDLTEADLRRLDVARQDSAFQLTSDPALPAEADAVIVCVPTPVDEAHLPETSALRSACAAVVANARVGQTIILTSTTYVGTTRELLAEPLRRRGFRIGHDIFVAFSPERVDPGNNAHLQHETPRVVGGTTRECAARAARVIGKLTDHVYLVGSPEAAEATKLYENVYRAVMLALANEFADICGSLDLDPIEVTLAAATKPYGFLAAFPGPGVGGHCIPCDPHYLLWQLGREGRSAPIIERAMRSIAQRPGRVVNRVEEVLAAAGTRMTGARILLIGVSYKPGVADLRESTSLPIIDGLRERGAQVSYHDPLVPRIRLPRGETMHSLPWPQRALWDLIVIHTVHPGADYGWLADRPHLLDATYQFDLAPHREVV
ncbi:MAG TPA: nucleotide sugar dehydrogenase [Amycolatopsis sp.]|nr:nucleotide sugar dehydrogenase [Amycolatopsis sp.]